MRLPTAVVLLISGIALLGMQRGSAASIRNGSIPGAWTLTFTYTSYDSLGPSDRRVRIFSDGHLDWADFPFTILRKTPGRPLSTSSNCDGVGRLSASDSLVMSDLARALYDLEIPDGNPRIGTVTVLLSLTKGGNSYRAGGFVFYNSPENADPRVAKAASILSRYHCPKSKY
ncbi:MAG: hypothetical protein JOZ58_19840 [Acetobacteraceae bacterium]|nr:hypothetical protein [Acetobacteraceae bacterium]